MDLIICSNCGCNLTDDNDPLSPYILRIESPSAEGDGKVVSEFQFCKCCAEGTYALLKDNENALLNLHGENCNDILPYEYRCLHTHPSNVGHC